MVSRDRQASIISGRLPLQVASTLSSPAPAKSQKAVVGPGTKTGGLSIRARTDSSEIIESPHHTETRLRVCFETLYFSNSRDRLRFQLYRREDTWTTGY